MPASLRAIALAGITTLALSGCGGSEPPAAGGDTATTGAAAAVDEAPDVDALLANADIERGGTLYFQCRACHTMNDGGPHKVGPNLYGMFGREAGKAPGFGYSDAVIDSGIVWSPETVNAWLEQPARYLPGNTMVFVGVRDAQDRANLIAYLQQNTGAAPQ